MNNLKKIAKYSRMVLDDDTADLIQKRVRSFDIPNFVEFIEHSLNRAELEYRQNGEERFICFCEMYTKEINKDRLHQAQSEAQKLAEKAKDIMHSVEKLTCQMDKHELIQVKKNEELEQYFTNFESKILNSIGNVRYVIRCYKYGDLAEKIEAEFRKVIFKTPKVKQLSPIEKIGIAYKKM